MSRKFKVKLDLKIDKAKVDALVKKGGQKGLWMACDHLASESKKQVPLDTGMLKASCTVDVAGDGASATVSYDTPYAVIQHEATSYSHQRGRKAKYLEDPCNNGGVQKEMLELLKQGFASQM